MTLLATSIHIREYKTEHTRETMENPWQVGKTIEVTGRRSTWSVVAALEMRPWHFSGLGVRKVGAALEFAAMASRRACARKRRGGFLAPPQLLGDQLDGTAGQTLLRPEPRQRPSVYILRRPSDVLLSSRFFSIHVSLLLESSSSYASKNLWNVPRPE